ncbi:hypothetical protein OIDMADRAFT_16731 [Oidiodendron maius Zn]|uniref:Uncharacterized protein n=1 Tax=Oidiodendron maius (strain Zn) TaxID=913774 RepID=A0A0C3I0T5_OIDMZ|nr:hypothetical protein OIDMADRAFT_16731 [Oidiodendron maius Zn]
MPTSSLSTGSTNGSEQETYRSVSIGATECREKNISLGQEQILQLLKRGLAKHTRSS